MLSIILMIKKQIIVLRAIQETTAMFVKNALIFRLSAMWQFWEKHWVFIFNQT